MRRAGPDFFDLVDGPEEEQVFREPKTVSTGQLPNSRIKRELEIAHERYRDRDEGSVADYIPSLAAADPSLFGLAICGVDGQTVGIGDTDHAFSIQSISKAFVFALACQELGHEAVRRAVGVNNTGLAFNSVMALELNDGHLMNPMVNAGAIATTALVPGDSPDAQWEFIQDGLSRFAGHQLAYDAQVYASEAATNQRNRAIARLLESYGHLAGDPSLATDVYTRQCSLLVTAGDLAVMGATLADGGVNPITGDRVVSADVCQDTLTVMAACGLYERSGDWLFEVGMPGKSGVSGGIVTVSPGKGSLATFSPLLDAAGNSVRGQRATRYLSNALGMNLFASVPNGETPSG